MSLQLLYTYNRLAAKVVGRVMILTPSAARIRLAENLAVWLEEYELQGGPYLASCFAYHRWAWSPKLERLTMARYLKHYRDNAVEAAMWWRQLELDRKAREPIALSQGREIVKARFRYEDKEKLCRAQPDLSGGFSALSRHCKTCPEKEPCNATDHDAGTRVQRA